MHSVESRESSLNAPQMKRHFGVRERPSFFSLSSTERGCLFLKKHVQNKCKFLNIPEDLVKATTIVLRDAVHCRTHGPRWFSRLAPMSGVLWGLRCLLSDRKSSRCSAPHLPFLATTTSGNDRCAGCRQERGWPQCDWLTVHPSSLLTCLSFGIQANLWANMSSSLARIYRPYPYAYSIGRLDQISIKKLLGGMPNEM